ncbi:hypothetical protein GXM_05870 [Nostoc sphaeroides CCNUC1]|uniref:Uncharacterized protein n=1 Tax=Nostoc sphaeroides CCNUC1 TaxID=2653204 RepID=A0A5P8W6M1_9NOSO|nr:hypothetical protein GXM_05870 [Nostoc sphaeroides CCNUC1]
MQALAKPAVGIARLGGYLEHRHRDFQVKKYSIAIVHC